MDSELPVDAPQVSAERSDIDAEPACNLFIRLGGMLAQPVRHFVFARRESGVPNPNTSCWIPGICEQGGLDCAGPDEITAQYASQGRHEFTRLERLVQKAVRGPGYCLLVRGEGVD